MTIQRLEFYIEDDGDRDPWAVPHNDPTGDYMLYTDHLAALAAAAEREAKLVEALVVNVESCGCGMPKPCDYEEIAAVVVDDPDNINNYCDSCLSAFAALALRKELK